MERVLTRVLNGEIASYDHLLKYLCCSPRQIARDLMESSLFRRIPDLNKASLRPSLSSLLKMTVGNIKLSAPFAGCVASSVHGRTPKALLVGIAAVLSGAASLTYFQACRIIEHTRARIEKTSAPTSSREFMQYAERLYLKLNHFAAEDPP